jgi:hypothetical protein
MRLSWTNCAAIGNTRRTLSGQRSANLLGGKYANLRALAKENFDNNAELQERYGSWTGMEKQLQLPEQLACSVVAYCVSFFATVHSSETK